MKEKFKKHKKLFIILIVVIAGAVAVSEIGRAHV